MVQEILDLLPETKVPGSPAFVGSVINFRGKVIPLADIRIAFGMDATQETIDSRIIVIRACIWRASRHWSAFAQTRFTK